MRIRLFSFFFVSALLQPLLLHADTVVTFNLVNAVLGIPGNIVGSATGTVTIDTTTGVVLNENLTFYDNITVYANGTPTNINAGVPGAPVDDYLYTGVTDGTDANSTVEIFSDLRFPTTSLVGYTGGSLCDDPYPEPSPCGNFGSSGLLLLDPPYNSTSDITAGAGFLTGSLVPAAATPEPEAFALLGTGLIALAPLVRRRIRR